MTEVTNILSTSQMEAIKSHFEGAGFPVSLLVIEGEDRDYLSVDWGDWSISDEGEINTSFEYWSISDCDLVGFITEAHKAWHKATQ